MKAYVYTRYGSPDVLQLQEVPTPTPSDDEVLVRIFAASVNPLDWHVMRGNPVFVRLMTGLFGPKHTILGSDFAGRVEATGRNVKQFQPGNEVFGAKGARGGGFAESVCAAEKELAPKPENLSFEEAAAVPIAAITALQGLRDKGKIRPGQKVLIDGASGGVGTFAIQIARHFGAEVTAVCSTRHVETARSLGAQHVIDYTREDFTRGTERYDLILGANAFHSIYAYRRMLTEGGVFVGTGGGASILGMLQGMLVAPVLSRMGRRKVGSLLARLKQADLIFLKELLEARKIVPVIDRRYPFGEVPDAVRYLEDGHASGKVVISVQPQQD